MRHHSFWIKGMIRLITFYGHIYRMRAFEQCLLSAYNMTSWTWEGSCVVPLRAHVISVPLYYIQYDHLTISPKCTCLLYDTQFAFLSMFTADSKTIINCSVWFHMVSSFITIKMLYFFCKTEFWTLDSVVWSKKYYNHTR